VVNRRDILVSNRQWYRCGMTQRCQWHRWVKTQQCHWHCWVSEKLIFVYDLAPWHCLVKTQRHHCNHWVDEGTAESIWETYGALIPLKRKSNQSSSKDKLYYPRPLRQKLVVYVSYLVFIRLQAFFFKFVNTYIELFLFSTFLTILGFRLYFFTIMFVM
jgi:hypothetical protein